MRLRFTKPALAALDRVLDYIHKQSPSGAISVENRIKATLQLITAYPESGQHTSRKGIRRAVVTPYPYVVLYRIGRGEVVVQSVRHLARRPGNRAF